MPVYFTQTKEGIKLKMYEILLSVLGNVVGIVSLIITGLTFRKTKLVASEVKKLKSEAIEKVRYVDYRPIALSTLQGKLSAIKEAGFVSDSFLIELLETTRTLYDYSHGLSDESRDVIYKTYQFIKATPSSDIKKNKQLLIELVDYLTQIINILKKENEYD